MIVIDTAADIATEDGEPIDLTPTEFQILSLLVRRYGTIVRRNDIAREAFAGRRGKVTDRAIDVQVSNLRQKLTRLAGNYRITVLRGFGYQFHGKACVSDGTCAEAASR